MTGRFQVLPPLQPAAYASLRADIERHGPLVPIDVDEDGNVLDGHHRWAGRDREDRARQHDEPAPPPSRTLSGRMPSVSRPRHAAFRSAAVTKPGKTDTAVIACRRRSVREQKPCG